MFHLDLNLSIAIFSNTLSPDPQWFRAVLMQQIAGAGGQELALLFVDFGNIETINVSQVRKMLPEFVRGVPALINSLEIKSKFSTNVV